MNEDVQKIINRRNFESAKFSRDQEDPRDRKNGPVQRTDGRWLAYRNGLPLMNPEKTKHADFKRSDASG